MKTLLLELNDSAYKLLGEYYNKRFTSKKHNYSIADSTMELLREIVEEKIELNNIFKDVKEEFFQKGLMSKPELIIDPSGVQFIGVFRKGRLTGDGIAKFPNGDEYVGDLYDGKQDGHGTLTSRDGSFYKGDWKNGKRDGQGIEVTLNGEIYNGLWKDDKRV